MSRYQNKPVYHLTVSTARLSFEPHPEPAGRTSTELTEITVINLIRTVHAQLYLAKMLMRKTTVWIEAVSLVESGMYYLHLIS